MTVSWGESDRLPAADVVASALGITLALLADTLHVGWTRESEGVRVTVTGVPIAALNGVLALGRQVDARTVKAGLEAVERDGVPYCLQTRPDWKEGAAAIAAECGMTSQPEIPLMAATDLVAGPPIEELQIRLLVADEARWHCEVAGPAFGASADLFAHLITPEVLALDEVRGYVGEVDGEPVVTAISVTIGTGVGIFDVATLEQYRRRGYGAAITAHAVRDAIDGGASWAWLQSSQAGYSVYERLGFTTIERWPCWFSSD